jgi:hypothetical protein
MMSIRFKTTLGIMPVRRGLCPEGGPVHSAWPEVGPIPLPFRSSSLRSLASWRRIEVDNPMTWLDGCRH